MSVNLKKGKNMFLTDYNLQFSPQGQDPVRTSLFQQPTSPLSQQVNNLAVDQFSVYDYLNDPSPQFQQETTNSSSAASSSSNISSTTMLQDEIEEEQAEQFQLLPPPNAFQPHSYYNPARDLESPVDLSANIQTTSTQSPESSSSTQEETAVAPTTNRQSKKRKRAPKQKSTKASSTQQSASQSSSSSSSSSSSESNSDADLSKLNRRRERNRETARQSRIRKKMRFEQLEKNVQDLYNLAITHFEQHVSAEVVQSFKLDALQYLK